MWAKSGSSASYPLFHFCGKFRVCPPLKTNSHTTSSQLNRPHFSFLSFVSLTSSLSSFAITIQEVLLCTVNLFLSLLCPSILRESISSTKLTASVPKRRSLVFTQFEFLVFNFTLKVFYNQKESFYVHLSSKQLIHFAQQNIRP